MSRTALIIHLGFGLGVHGTVHADEQRWPDHAGYLVPISSFDTDDGFGGGVRFALTHQPKSHVPFKSSTVFQSFMTNRGYQQHLFRWDRRGLGRDGGARLFVHLEWRQWLNDGYWGIGNGTERIRTNAERATLDPEDPARKFHRYTLWQPMAHIGGSRLIGTDGPGAIYGAIQLKSSRVQAYEDSLLAQEQPFGMAGGMGLQGLVGVLFEQRQPEIAPQSGWMLDAGVRAAPDIDGEAGGFGGPHLEIRHYQPIGHRLVWAHRWMGEWLWGSVPFYEMVHWGGFSPIAGFGGAMTLRGLSFGRWRAPGKMIFNSELRINALQHRIGKRHRLGWEVAPYVDVGRVMGAMELDSGPLLHPAMGVGWRIILDETFVGRIDTGVGYDPVQGSRGIQEQLTPGIYIYFDHAY